METCAMFPFQKLGLTIFGSVPIIGFVPIELKTKDDSVVETFCWVFTYPTTEKPLYVYVIKYQVLVVISPEGVAIIPLL
jgi:hypothetical protein